jgi:hypothetical protein
VQLHLQNNLTYGAENRLTGVSGAASATFVYDGDGNRVKATLGGVTTAYVGNYFEWTGSTSMMKKYYLPAPACCKAGRQAGAGSARVAMRVGNGSGTTGLSWLLSDHGDPADRLGSTSLATTASGAEVTDSRTLYYPCGQGTLRARALAHTGGSTLPTDYGNSAGVVLAGQRNEFSGNRAQFVV